ncbi:MAG: hypothetical protein ACEPOV_00625 [Hyphomicrobiales bacterium]
MKNRIKLDDFDLLKELVIYDSLDLPLSTSLHIYDFNPNSSTYLGLLGNYVIGFNTEEKVFSFDRFGEGPNEYHYMNPFFAKTKFLRDTLVMINGNNYLKLYDFNGDLQRKICINDNAAFKIRHFLGKSSIDSTKYYFQGINKEYDHSKGVTDFDLDNQRIFFEFSEKDMKSRQYGKFEKENIIRDKKRSYIFYKPLITYNDTLNTIDVIFSAEPKLYRYDMNNEASYKVIELQPESYGKMEFLPEKQRKPSTFDPRDRFTYLSNSYYKNLYSKADTIITCYRAGIDRFIVNNERPYIEEVTDYVDFINDNFRYYINYYVKGKKICRDINVPHKHLILHIGNTNNIALKKLGQDIIVKGTPIQRIYFARISDS